MHPIARTIISGFLAAGVIFGFGTAAGAATTGTLAYPIVDTGQTECYDTQGRAIAPPAPGRPLSGQDGQYAGNTPGYRDNGDGTVTDLVTGLMWQQASGGKKTFAEAVGGAATLRLAGHDDWRLPTIKELYSLILFTGSSPRRIPYLDTRFFAFEWGDATGGRLIDSQYWSATEYVGATFRGAATVFGVNFADGRIKGYPRDRSPQGGMATHYVFYVRGNPRYGVNRFVDNGDGTVSDEATGLMWMREDSGALKAGPRGDGTLDWPEALAWAEGLSYSGHEDWRLPNAKELQSIVDYGRAPDAASAGARGPAIAPVFRMTDPESWHWTGTTHLDGRGDQAVYVCFGRAFGVFPNGLVNVHGAGAQRSDPKTGDPAAFKQGRGPQRDQVRIRNYVRCVRGGLSAKKP